MSTITDSDGLRDVRFRMIVSPRVECARTLPSEAASHTAASPVIAAPTLFSATRPRRVALRGEAEVGDGTVARLWTATAADTLAAGLRMTISFGVSASARDGEFDYKTVFAEADAALYEAKAPPAARGKDRGPHATGGAATSVSRSHLASVHAPVGTYVVSSPYGLPTGF